MVGYRLSNRAEVDLEAIADYTVDTWGPEQAIRYITGLLDCCERIALNPQIGRPCQVVRTGYRRIEHERHVLFYRVIDGDAFIARILHQGMLPEKHVLDDSEAT
jgi:toxin ParE1/3/4